MADGFYDKEGIFIPGNQVKEEYEIQSHERESIDAIREMLKRRKFKSREEILSYIELLENLNAKVAEIVRQEEQGANDNWTLKLQQEEIVSLFKKLREEYLRL